MLQFRRGRDRLRRFACRLGVLLPRPSNGRLRAVVGVDGPSSGLIPTGGVSRRKASLASASEVKVSVQGEADVRPGTVVLEIFIISSERPCVEWAAGNTLGRFHLFAGVLSS